MKASGRNNACPVCGRTKDADCRWNDTTILCHTGTDLKPGDTLTSLAPNGHSSITKVDSAAWQPSSSHIVNATVRSGNATYSDPPQTVPHNCWHQQKRTQWSDVLDQFFAAFDAAWEVPDFCSCTPDQPHAFAAIDDAQTKAAALAPHPQTIWREHPDLKQLHRLRVEDNLKAIAYMADDVRRFKEQDLGTLAPRLFVPVEDEEL